MTHLIVPVKSDLFDLQVHDDSNGVFNTELRSLSWGPYRQVLSWPMYFVNGYKFHTRVWSHGKKTTNSGVYVKGVTQNGEDDFYGILEHIYELEYHELPTKIALFYCQWYDPSRRGTRVHSQYKIVEINKSRRYQQYDPFIIAQQARQVYYVNYPATCSRELRGWSVAITTKPRGHIEVDDIVDGAQSDESPFQSDEPVLPIMQIEEMEMLVDGNSIEHEVDPLPEPMDNEEEVQDVHEEDTDEVHTTDNDDDHYYDDEDI